ncbi:hypothetical protein MPTK1_4g05540 [Marchantia polymorpha subsp. ruderalis]|uniref:Uncharacterized protein n=1 Tax=Marchantia polymorpha subsp. ruderalis TaxID=1480154 RepID=A0AAF6B6P1_MARPO|nr:hypothetical protein Mp_4g05540 [Marchantia polymorpha subsp. ruderalis]
MSPSMAGNVRLGHSDAGVLTAFPTPGRRVRQARDENSLARDENSP